MSGGFRSSASWDLRIARLASGGQIRITLESVSHDMHRTIDIRGSSRVRIRRHWFPAVAGALMLAVVCLPAPAENGDAGNVQQVIADQIAAFADGDSTRAFSHAAPSIQMRFRTPAIFMRMVEQGYEPVFRPRSFAFTEFRAEGGSAVQMLEVVGPDGAPWVAVYTLEKQPDGAWRISGCYLRPGTGA